MKTQNFIETGSLLLLRENITREKNCSKLIKGFFFQSITFHPVQTPQVYLQIPNCQFVHWEDKGAQDW